MSGLAPDYHRSTGSGKTPPPAPSAVYAKRAREIQAEEGLAGRYRPPALRAAQQQQTLVEDTSYDSSNNTSDASVAPANYPAGFRRARAGTLPSNVQLAAQNYASSLTSPITPSDIAESPLPSPVTRPVLRHAASSTSSILASERNSRLRSGSLTTLPTGGLSNAFGPSIFSSSWLSAGGNNSAGRGFGVLEELRGSLGDGQPGEEYDVHTLDYLGLDDGPRGPAYPPPATVSELRNQTQAAIVGSLTGAGSRLRANTVANPYRRAQGLQQRLAPSLEPSDEDDSGSVGADYDYHEYQANNNNSNQYIRQQQQQQLDSYDTSSQQYGENPYIAKGFKQQDHLGGLSSRSRASTVGNLDDPSRSQQRRRVAIEEPQQQQQSAYNYQGAYDQHDRQSLASAPTPTPGSILRSLQIETNVPTAIHLAQQPIHTASPSTRHNNIASPSIRFPPSAGGINAPHLHHDPRSAVSPRDGPGSALQTPSRSLWIGNLDSSVSGEDLARAFAPYGAIESFRLLPEKECGFVNFVEISDAMRAKDDVLNRLGGLIGMANNQAVRIGFGKTDSAPVTPSGPNSGGTHSSHFLTTPGGPMSAGGLVGGLPSAGPLSAGGLASPGGMDAQVQSSPTRALWIGSIPSTTTPATILSVFSPFGPIESARVLTHKNCGFVNFERLDDAVRARKALNGRDVLGSDVGAIRIGFARVPVKTTASPDGPDDATNPTLPPVTAGIQGVGDLSVGATIHALRAVKGATAVPTDQQVLGGAVENYRSNLLLSMLSTSTNPASVPGAPPSVTEQQLIMRLLSDGNSDADVDVLALGEFRPPTTYYTSIPLAAERAHNRRWDAHKLRELRKRLDSGSCTVEEIDDVAADFLDGEIVDLASDWLGNTVVQKLFERCSPSPRYAMLERIAPNLAMIGIHKNGTWAAQKVIECANTAEEIALIAINLRAYTPPLLLDQFGNYVVQCCLRFGSPANEFIFDAMTDRLWEIAQGRFGARSMRACLESPYITLSQQRRIATAVILNSIPLATNPNGALLLTWLLDTSGFHSRYRLLAPRFTPHLSHLCTHKLASLTVLRIVNQKAEPEASAQIVQALFFSPADHVLTDVLGDQINGVAVVHKILQSPFLDPMLRPSYLEATKRVLTDLKVTSAQAYRRLIEEVGLPTPNYVPSFSPSSHHQNNGSVTMGGANGLLNSGLKKPGMGSVGPHSAFGNQGMSPIGGQNGGYPQDPSLASMMVSMQALQLQANAAMNGIGGNVPSHNGQGNHGLLPHGSPLQSGPPQLQINPAYGQQHQQNQMSAATFSPSTDPFNPFSLRSPEMTSPAHNLRGNQHPQQGRRMPPGSGISPNGGGGSAILHNGGGGNMYSAGGSIHNNGGQNNGNMGLVLDQLQQGAPQYGMPAGSQMHPQMYQAYMYQMFQQQQQNAAAQNGGFHV